MSITPAISLASIGCLSDGKTHTLINPNSTLTIFIHSNKSNPVLREMPLVTPTDYYIENDAAHQLSSLSLFDNQQQFDKASQLINSTDPSLVELLSHTLSQIDTSKIQLKHDIQKKTSSQALHIPPILQSALAFNQNLFNGALNDQFAKLKHQRNTGNSQQQPQQQQYPGPSSSALAAATTSLAASSQNLAQPTTNSVQSTQSFYSKQQQDPGVS